MAGSGSPDIQDVYPRSAAFVRIIILVIETVNNPLFGPFQ